MRRLLFSLLFMLSVLVASAADNVSFEASSPRVVAVGEVFRVEFSLNASPDDFTPPSFGNLTVVAGPTTSQGQSISIINGNMTKSVNFTYTYILQAPSAGNYTIDQAKVVVEGQSYNSNKLIIEVVSDGGGSSSSSSASSAQRGGSSSSGRSTGTTASTTVAADDILVRVVASKTDVYKGEPINVKFILYTRIPISGIESPKYPSFNGFWTQDINVDRYSWNSTTLGDKVYDSRIIREYLVFPQQSGTLNIEQFSMTVIAQIVSQTRQQSMFDNFFGGGATVQEVRKSVSATPIAINVKELPDGAPASFNGAVGEFTISSDISSTEIGANTSATYTINISGSGNLSLIQTPKLELPASMEQYNIKTTESLKTGSNNITGYRQFEYPFIPRSEGDYTIPAVDFSYFNPQTVRYVTLSTPPSNVIILADSTTVRGGGSSGIISGLNREDIKILDEDIRFIKLGAPEVESRGGFLIVSWDYYLYLLIIVLGTTGAYLYLRHTLAQRRNVAVVRNKKANKVALQRLKAAQKYMQAEDQRQFYQEMLQALWGYMSDKLNIPVSNLTKDNIRESLAKRNISAESANKFIDIISECEYAQYSPSSSGKMNDIYDDAAEMLSKFESLIKK